MIDLNAFRAIARQTAEQAFKHDQDSGNTDSALAEFREAIKDLEIMVANLQLDIEIEAINKLR